MHILLISILLVIFTYGFILGSFVFFGRIGLFISIPVAVILANLQVVVTVDFFGLALTLGNVAYASSYLISDLLNELYTKKDAQNAVFIGFFTLIMTTVIMNIVLLYTPSADSLVMYESVENIFKLLPRIVAASLTAYIVSQSLDVVIFSKIKNKSNGKKLWLRNNISTVTSQLLDNMIFTFLAFTGVYDFSVVCQIFITTYIVKFIISICDTPFMYLGVYLKKNNIVREIENTEK